MSTVSRDFPAHPHLDVPKRQAKELFAQAKSKEAEALDRVRRRHPHFHHVSEESIAPQLTLSGVQLDPG